MTMCTRAELGAAFGIHPIVYENANIHVKEVDWLV